jgi:hypothetical protein
MDCLRYGCIIKDVDEDTLLHFCSNAFECKKIGQSLYVCEKRYFQPLDVFIGKHVGFKTIDSVQLVVGDTDTMIRKEYEVYRQFENYLGHFNMKCCWYDTKTYITQRTHA